MIIASILFILGILFLLGSAYRIGTTPRHDTSDVPTFWVGLVVAACSAQYIWG